MCMRSLLSLFFFRQVLRTGGSNLRYVSSCLPLSLPPSSLSLSPNHPQRLQGYLVRLCVYVRMCVRRAD